MLSYRQFVRLNQPAHARKRVFFGNWFLLLMGFVLSVMPLRAQQAQAPPGTIGVVEGNDVSVEGAAVAANGTATSAPSMFVGNGSVVTVHSGQARMSLLEGGALDICGPAKFTLLQSGPAITLALNFGRIHVRLPAPAQLRIFTPTIVATPIDIGGAPRDFTVGLDLQDSLCVVATSGALRLEQQFTGEGLIVPQAGEFFLSGGKLIPVAGVTGSCQCLSAQARVSTPPLPTSPNCRNRLLAKSRSQVPRSKSASLRSRIKFIRTRSRRRTRRPRHRPFRYPSTRSSCRRSLFRPMALRRPENLLPT